MYINNIYYYNDINNTTNGNHCILTIYVITVTLITQLMVPLYINNIDYYSNINNTTNGNHCILIIYIITVTLITQLMVATVY